MRIDQIPASRMGARGWLSWAGRTTPLFHDAAILVLCAGVLSTPTLINGAPYIFYDSEHYFLIGRGIFDAVLSPVAPSTVAPSGQAALVPDAETGGWAGALAGARSPVYSVFLYMSLTLGGLWGVVAVQAGLLSGLLASLCRWILPESWRTAAVGLSVGIASLTPVGFFTGFMMPDVFAGMAVLAIIVLVFWRDAPPAERRLVWTMLALSACMHTTIAALCVLAAPLGAAALLAMGESRSEALRRGLTIALSIVPAIVSSVVYAEATLALKGVEVRSPPYLTARIIADGPGQRYLDEVCPLDPDRFAVCRFSGRRFEGHNAFLWGEGGTEPAYLNADPALRRALSHEQFAFALSAFLHDPLAQTAASVRNFADQFVAISPRGDAVSSRALVAEWPGSVLISEFFPRTTPCRIAGQECNEFPELVRLEALGGAGFALALLFVAGLSIGHLRRGDRAAYAEERAIVLMLLMVLLLLVANAALCGALSGVHDRYQARISWALPLLAIMACVRLLHAGARAGARPPYSSALRTESSSASF
jgi:hypothetical protein